ncbi:MAG: DnaJ domain-containing protein [Tepidiformaceae bacterium]
MQPDYYATLEVPADASLSMIRSAYRRLAKEHHPDRNESSAAKARMQSINEAWSVLSDAAQRAEFDRARPRGRAPQQQAWSGRTGPRRPPPSSRGAGPAPPPAGDGGRSVFEEERASAPFRGRVNARQPGPRHFTGDPRTDWYEHLGVRANASVREILQALNERANELAAAKELSAAEVTERSRRNREAWETLGNAHVRAEYDRARRQLGY